MEEENKKVRISSSTVLLFITIIIVVIMGCIIYKLNTDKTTEIQKTAELQTQIDSLNGTIDNLQGKLNTISNNIDNEKIEEIKELV